MRLLCNSNRPRYINKFAHGPMLNIILHIHVYSGKLRIMSDTNEPAKKAEEFVCVEGSTCFRYDKIVGLGVQPPPSISSLVKHGGE